MSQRDGRGDPDGHVLRRRSLLGSIAAAGTAGLAGCGTTGGAGSGGADTTLTTFMANLPTDYNWTKEDYMSAWPRLVTPLVFDRLAMQRGDGDVVGMLATDWGYDDTAVRIELAASGWSDGSPVLGADVGLGYLLERYATGRSPGAVVDEGDPRTVLEATTDVTWDGRTVTLHSDPGFYADFHVESWLRSRLTEPGEAEVVQHRSTLREKLDAVESLDDPYGEAARDALATIRAPPTTEGGAPAERDPADALVSGPFKADEMRGGRVVLGSNPHYRKASEVAFERVDSLALIEERARWGALRSNTLDAVPGLFGTPPPNVVDAFPDNIRYHRWGAGTLKGFVTNPEHDQWLGRPRVRQALAYALDKSKIATVKHPYAARAPTDPPGLTYRGAEQWVDEDLTAAFHGYDHDLERAAELLRAAGFSRPREGATWRTPEGERWTLELLTSAKNVQVESSVVANLNALGVDATLARQSETNTAARINRGDFQLTVHDWTGPPDGLFREALLSSKTRRLWSLWPREAVRSWVENTEGVTIEEYAWTNKVEGYDPEQTKQFTLSAPPVGEPDSEERIDYPVVYMDLRLDRGLPPETRRRYKQVLAWVFNWQLPLVPYTQSFNLAFQDHEEWDAPTEAAAWDTYAPTFRLISEGRIAPADA